MVRTAAVAVMLVLAGCADSSTTIGPPITQFYFPGALAHVDVPGKTEGVLFVANANLDKRYARGSVVAVALDDVGLPALGANTGQVPQLVDLKLAETQAAEIASFAGELAVTEVSAGEYRLYVPTRSEGMRVYRVRASIGADGRPVMRCMATEGQNCVEEGVSVSPLAFEQSATGVPRAPGPYGVGTGVRTCSVNADCCPAGATECGRTCTNAACVGTDGLPFSDVWVTHQTQADSPTSSATNYRSYLVRLDSDAFTVDESSFINIGQGATNSVTVLNGWAYASGRYLSPAPNLMRMVRADGVTLSSGLEYTYRVADSRGLALSSDRSKLYLVGRSPDTLLTMTISNAVSAPITTFARATALPDAPEQVAVVPRPGQGDLVLVTCTSARNLAIYDEDVGDLVALVAGVGLQPAGIAVDVRGSAARVFVSAFGDGRVAVIDIPDLSRPQTARLVAHLGAQQVCLTRGVDSPGCKAVTQ